MASNLLGALRFGMSVDTAEFERAMKGAEGTLKRVAAVGAAVGTLLGNALTGAFHSLKESVKTAIESADKMDELAESIGITVEKLSGLRFAADLSGVGLDSLATNMTKLGRSMAESVAEPASTAARTLQAMGISATDASGQLRPINDVFLDIADRFRTYEDGAAKVALATNLFGRAGAAMIPLLNQGRDGIAQQADEAARLGLTLDTKTIKAAASFNDTLTKMSRIWDGFIMQLTAKLLPTLQFVAERFAKLTSDSNSLKLALEGVDITIKSVVTSGIIVKAVFETLATAIAAVIAAMVLLGQLEFRAAMDTLRQGTTDFTTEVRNAVTAVKDLWAGVQQWQTTIEQAGANAGTHAAPIVASANAMRDATREWRDEQRAAMDEIVNSPIETYTAKMAELQVALQTGVINWRTYGQMVRRVEEENRQNISSTASLVASTLTTVFGKSKAAGIAAAIINTAVGITNALAKLPPPYSWAQAALIAASGAAQIATIKSTNEKGGGGGAPAVHGGGAGDGGSEAQQAGPSQMFQVNLHGSRFSRDDVVGLIEDMNEAIADGAHLVVRQ
jgi:ribosomal protein L12E/L44/L45/RPP1/RPP2